MTEPLQVRTIEETEQHYENLCELAQENETALFALTALEGATRQVVDLQAKLDEERARRLRQSDRRIAADTLASNRLGENILLQADNDTLENENCELREKLTGQTALAAARLEKITALKAKHFEEMKAQEIVICELRTGLKYNDWEPRQ